LLSILRYLKENLRTDRKGAGSKHYSSLEPPVFVKRMASQDFDAGIFKHFKA